MATREQGATPNRSLPSKGSVTYTNPSIPRRIGSDRSDLKQQNQIRNVRTSNMPGSKRSDLGSYRKTTDQLFNAEYSKKGIQPHSILAEKENRRSKKSFLKYLGIEDSNSLIEQILEEMQDDDQTAGYTRQVAKVLESLRDTDFDESFFEEFLHQLPSGAQQAMKRRGIIRKILLLLAYRKAFRLNKWIWSWGLYSWGFFQLPFALLGLAILAVAIAIEDTLTSISVPKEDAGVIERLSKGAVNLVAKGVATIAKAINDNILNLFGVDLAAFNPVNFFIVPYGLVWAYGIIVLLLMYLIYSLALLNPLSGDGGGAKKGALLLAIIGYSIPGLNLFPWFMVWTFAVLRYPK